MLHRCRPAGAWVWGGHRITIQMPPRWGYGGVGTAMLHTYRPAGAKNLFVVVRFIARSLLVNDTPCSYYLASQVQFVPIEEQQSAVRSRDSEIPPTGRAVSNQISSGAEGRTDVGKPTDAAPLGLRRGGHRIIPFLKGYIALTAPERTD